MPGSLIFCEVYSTQLERPIIKRVNILSDVLNILNSINDDVMFDIYIDKYLENNPLNQGSFSLLGQHSKDDVKNILIMMWNILTNMEPAFLSESALAKDWLTPEEHNAWKDL
jgi:hypothetical protein